MSLQEKTLILTKAIKDDFISLSNMGKVSRMINKYIPYIHAEKEFDRLIDEAATGSVTRALYKAKEAVMSEVCNSQPFKSKWCPPLMGQGKCDTYCGRCYGKIMRNSTGIFEETPFCPHCGASMDKS